ncbi:MAG: DUF445 domain-containing protein [Hyphomonadaceae bacterium]|nr:DUF445 domain-containing protein [Hyphomonadaceae bacterium]
MPSPNAAQNRAASLPAMRAMAGALLVAMVVVYLVAVLNHDRGPVWGYVRAFAEAAMVGGLADWFAVTAIFRRPVGLPIPHTAVIPRSKGRIADALGEFVTVNFLAPDIVRDRLKDQDLAGGLARQIADPAAARKIADGIMDALPSIADLLDDAAVADFMRRQIAEFSRDERLSASVGRGLRLLTDHGRHQPVLDAALVEGFRALEEHEPAIRKQVRAKTGWVWRLISLDARASDALIAAIESTLKEIARDPEHPARHRVTELLQRFADELEHSPRLRAQIERIVADILAHPAVGAYFTDMWHGVKGAVRAGAAAPDSAARVALADAIARFGEALKADAEVQTSINRRLRALLADVAGRHGRDVASLISETIKSWDAKTVVEKLEQNVGPDLQYIRINGTLIGGLIGLSIHQVTVMLT